MKVDFSQGFKDLDGRILVEPPGGKPITLRTLAVNVLMATFEDEKNLSGEEKVKRYETALMVHNSKDEPVEMSVEDVALIKRLIGKSYGPLFVGQAWKMLEG